MSRPGTRGRGPGNSGQPVDDRGRRKIRARDRTKPLLTVLWGWIRERHSTLQALDPVRVRRLGLVALALSLLMTFAPTAGPLSALEIVGTLVASRTVIAILGAVVAVGGLVLAVAGEDSAADRTGAEVTLPDYSESVGGESPDTVATPVDGALDDLADSNAAPSDPEYASAKTRIRTRLRDTAADLLMEAHGMERETAVRRIDSGSWTDDRRAAAFLGEGVPDPPLGQRVCDWVRGVPLRRQAEASVREVRSLAERTVVLDDDGFGTAEIGPNAVEAEDTGTADPVNDELRAELSAIEERLTDEPIPDAGSPEDHVEPVTAAESED